MEITIEFEGKPINIQLSRDAEAALRQRTTPLVAEMELYFSCLIRKQVRFHSESSGRRAVAATEKLYVTFHPVMTEQCQIDNQREEKAMLTDFPINRPGAFIPHWLRLDYRHGEWVGEFGYL